MRDITVKIKQIAARYVEDKRGYEIPPEINMFQIQRLAVGCVEAQGGREISARLDTVEIWRILV